MKTRVRVTWDFAPNWTQGRLRWVIRPQFATDNAITMSQPAVHCVQRWMIEQWDEEADRLERRYR